MSQNNKHNGRRSRPERPSRRPPPAFRVELTDDQFRLFATGRWTAREAARIGPALAALAAPVPDATDFSVIIDLAGIERIDTAGAWLLVRAKRRWQQAGLSISFRGADADMQLLLDEVSQRGTLDLPATGQHPPFIRFLGDIGRTVIGIGHDALQFIGFLGALTQVMLRVMFQPWRFRLVPFVHHLEYIGFRAVPIIALICLLIGAVILQQGSIQLAKYGAEALSINMLGILALREVGVLLTAIMVAGRSGSAFTAEIGSMKMREEIDAMRTLGIDPMEVLVIPRMLALILILPLLTFIGDIMCLVGGALMAKIYLGIDFLSYLDRLRDTLQARHFFAGLLKAPFAGIAIGIIGTLEGLKVSGSAESLGQHVTSSVVKAIFLVIILDAVFAILFSAIGL